MGELDKLGSEFRISINPDESGFVGRECPNVSCHKYFKIRPGTGLTGPNLPCICPYCGHEGGAQTFFTPEQIEYAKSVVMNKVTNAILADMKNMEFERDLGLGLKLSMKVEGQPHPINRYREIDLETQVTCDKCTLQYFIYGVFSFCPDCGSHNSLQILLKNLELVQKGMELSEKADPDLRERLLSDALNGSVSAFDGFGREVLHVNQSKTKNTKIREKKISFQNILKAQDQVRELFGFDFLSILSENELTFLKRCFQKRHLFIHKMGVVDQEYLNLTNDSKEVVGRKVSLVKSEIASLTDILRRIGHKLVSDISKS